MNPALITYHDSRLISYVSQSAETATHFANTFGLDVVAESTGSWDMWGHMKKIELAIRELKAGRPYVVYADVDIIFNKVLAENFINDYHTGSFAVLRTPVGLETSFFIANNDSASLSFLNTWSSSYTNPYVTDEISFMSLYVMNKSIRDTITMIPAIPYISSPFCGGPSGSIGKHFYSSTSQASSLHWMKMYKIRYFDNA